MILRAVAALVCVLLAPRLAAAEPISYVILKEGEPIGHETVDIERNGDVAKVEVNTETRVKVLFLDFHYRHHRQEFWRAGRLERMVADTDDDGSVHHIVLESGASGPGLTLDGTGREMPDGALPLSLWSKAILDRKVLYGVSDAALYRVAIDSLGMARLAWHGRDIAAEHYRIGGDVERDLWYGEDGLLLKTAFQRRGYPIEIIRE
ncbi:DUF6134 family protein [Telmatospirillum siberiense]|uniref:DUF3108 domain-containing protein n=1 Tax=Telmatospirillum siberiense TaxID=382514 RepID=A0A2N3PY12_9PROT|nr:DUF6134 family protein [Telmatospirillum siberiense]PKU25310.1 hypothetical protein CWS72_06855 [Telmatospirillum siberiense]